MAKFPSFQFYPGDWRKDPGVQALSFHDRGVWFEILCLMHESEIRGKLTLNGVAMPGEALARLLGLDNQILTTTITTLLTFGVASLCPDTGAIMSRRMVRDEEIRQVRKSCGKLGGNPKLVNQKPTTQVKVKPTPSSSSSSSSSSSDQDPPISPKGLPLFEGKGGAPAETTPDLPSQVIAYLNQKTGKKFRPETEAHRSPINARAAEGFTLPDFQKVIDNKAADWMDDPKMNEFLCPDTLFRPSKFEKYLNQTAAGVREQVHTGGRRKVPVG